MVREDNGSESMQDCVWSEILYRHWQSHMLRYAMLCYAMQCYVNDLYAGTQSLSYQIGGQG